MEKPAAQKPLEVRAIHCAYGASSSLRCLSCISVEGVATCKPSTLELSVVEYNLIRVHELLTGNASDVHKLTKHD